jgi:hypothetical protein
VPRSQSRGQDLAVLEQNLRDRINNNRWKISDDVGEDVWWDGTIKDRKGCLMRVLVFAWHQTRVIFNKLC